MIFSWASHTHTKQDQEKKQKYPGVASSIPACSHTFVEIDHEIISTVILLPSAESFKKGCCQLQAKVCAQLLVNCLFKPQGGGGGYSQFFFIRSFGPSIYPSPQKISGMSNTPKIFEILATFKNILHSVP